jgi:hypothetical protein
LAKKVPHSKRAGKLRDGLRKGYTRVPNTVLFALELQPEARLLHIVSLALDFESENHLHASYYGNKMRRELTGFSES